MIDRTRRRKGLGCCHEDYNKGEDIALFPLADAFIRTDQGHICANLKADECSIFYHLGEEIQ